MRLPEYEKLSQSQVDIYRDKIDGNMLVSGPPGSGKTVLAIHRALKLKSEYEGEDVNLVMYNNTLQAYSTQGSSNESLGFDKIQISTLHKFLKRWYKSWQEYSRELWPFIGVNIIYDKIHEQIINLEEGKLDKLNWGHLIIDEGQDFPEALYNIFVEAQFRLQEYGIKNSTISVFADDNQTITENNSSVAQIKTAMCMRKCDTRHYRINENYRNSAEIYDFAKHFQVNGANSTKRPTFKTEDIPWVMFTKKIDKYYEFIVKAAENSNKSVGVICLNYLKDVHKAITEIKKITKTAKVYGYSSKDKNYNNANDINFDEGGSITVLHSQSAKGLEFDIVFILNTETLQVNDHHAYDKFKKLYVVTTRAREQLRVCFLYDELPASLGLFPIKKMGEIFKIQSTIKDLKKEIDSFKKWRRSPDELAEEAREKVLSEIKNKYSNYPISNDSKILEIIKNKNSDKSFEHLKEKYNISGSLDSLAWYIVECGMESKVEEIFSELVKDE